jgi:hypothetical protein
LPQVIWQHLAEKWCGVVHKNEIKCQAQLSRCMDLN